MIRVNQIYDYVESQINLPDRRVYCSSVDEPIPASFPACQIFELSHAQYQNATPLAFASKEHVSVRRNFEVHVFSNLKNKALSEARSIMDDVEIAFRQLSFIETTCMQTDNADPNVVNLVARFTRNIGDGDEIINS